MPGFNLAYSARSGALLEFDDEEWPVASRLLNGRALDEIDNTGVFQRLVKGLFLVPADEDEITAVAKFRERGKAWSGWLSLTIAPTMQCNFRCTYCFEEHRAEFMTEAVVDSVQRFVVEQLDSMDSPAGVAITWFGGEPLMAARAIESIQRFVNHLCEERGLGVSRSIITNGFLLTEAMVGFRLLFGSTSMRATPVGGNFGKCWCSSPETVLRG